MNSEPALPSLLSREATGGDTAEGGFSFQEAVLLAKLPRWLSMDGFTQCIREAVCDFEASFFVPGVGLRLEGVEAKVERQTASRFWEEIETFQRISQGSKLTYAGFSLVCSELSDELRPMINGLRRLRDPYPFYNVGGGVLESSYNDYESKVLALGKDAATALFMFQQVLVEPNWAMALVDAEAVFLKSMKDHLPWSADCSAANLSKVYDQFKKLVQSRKAQPILRHELEDILDSISPQSRPAKCVRIHTRSGVSETQQSGPVTFSWERFFSDVADTFPAADEWDRDLGGSLAEFHSWAVANRRPKRIRVTGARRLSASMAVGGALSAVAGYTLEVEDRGTIWSTDAHPNALTRPYAFTESLVAGSGTRLTVIVGIIRDISSDVASFSKSSGLSGNPILHLFGAQAIEDAAQANFAVRLAKESIVNALARTATREIDLFFAGPTPLAILFAHRLNATAPIRCYGRTSTDGYRPTCRLFG